MNRYWAVSDDHFVDGALSRGLAARFTNNDRILWRLDRQRGVASPEQPTEHLKNFTVPLRPMMGSVAVADSWDSAPPSRDSGPFGGNMDFNEIVEGTTLYLPVMHAGALLYVGDGHAAMGDGN